MADALKIQINGLGDLLTKLRTFPDKLQKKGLRTAMRKGATVVKNAAVANAQRVDDTITKEQIFRNITVQTATRLGKRYGGIAMRVGVLGGAKQYGNTKENVRKGRVGQSYKTLGDKGNPGGDTWYWRFLEFGTSKMSARPFMLPALESNTEAAIEVIANTLRREIDKFTAKGTTL